jgi:PAS domain S-box-containing protein
VDEPHDHPADASLQGSATSVVDTLASHGSAAVFLVAAGELGSSDRSRQLLAGSVPSGAPPAVSVAVPSTGQRIEVVSAAPVATVQLAAELLANVAERAASRAHEALVQRRLADGERIGRMGSFDWDLRQDVVVPSDELLRLTGVQPGSAPGGVERFLERVHPDDRERVRTALERSRSTGEALELESRVVRPDGGQRILLTNAEVLRGPDGTPERLVGVSRDVTEHRRIEGEARTAAARFETLVAAAPDAILVVGEDGRITAVNPQAERLFGYPVDELVGLEVDQLLPEDLRTRHVELREGYLADARPRPMGAGLDLEARRADGTAVPVDIGLTPIGGDVPAVAAFVRDATSRREAEADRRRFAEARLRRRQALELNDTVVQGLVALLWQLDGGETGEARRIAEATLAAARRIMADLLRDDLDELEADHLVRSEHAGAEPAFAHLGEGHPFAVPPHAAAGDGRSVLIADDAADLRFLLRHRLNRASNVHVVAEAADGQQAIDLALEHRPDVVLLDLSMPVLDGLEAARRIRAAVPDARIVVLSGYPDEIMRERAMGAGADLYCEKTASLDEVYDAVTGSLTAR